MSMKKQNLLIIATLILSIVFSGCEKNDSRPVVTEKEEVNETISLFILGDNLLHMPVINSGKKSDGTYEYWVNIEMPKVKVVEEVAESITKDESLEVDFNQHLFRKVFDEEMALEMQRQAQGK